MTFTRKGYLGYLPALEALLSNTGIPAEEIDLKREFQNVLAQWERDLAGDRAPKDYHEKGELWLAVA